MAARFHREQRDAAALSAKRESPDNKQQLNLSGKPIACISTTLARMSRVGGRTEIRMGFYLNGLPRILKRRAVAKRLLLPVLVVLMAPQLLAKEHAHGAWSTRIHQSAPSPGTSRHVYCDLLNVEPGIGGGQLPVGDFTINLKPVQDSDAPRGMSCRVTIVSPRGETVFHDDALNVEIEPITGKDVNEDGAPDVVFENFTGGAHCCWDYEIVSLGKTPGLVGEFENRAPVSFKDLTGDGKVEILIPDGSFDGGFGMAHPYSPFPLLIVRLNGTTFEDVGAKFWPEYEKEIGAERKKLKEKDLRDFLQSNPTEIHDDEQYFDTEYRILAIALDYLYADRPEEARKFLNESWPAKYEDKTWREMVYGYCSGLRSEMKLAVPRSCVENLLGEKHR